MAVQYAFFTCDVFTRTRFGGNPLAVFPRADGLSDGQMQQIAREFNYSESTFVFPASGPLSRKVRIFTPTTEVPFAGHPNIGTAFVLADTGELGEIGDGITVTFDEAAGTVPVTVRPGDDGMLRSELVAPEPLALGDTVDPSEMAHVLSIGMDDVRDTVHPPQVASVGLPFLVVEVASRDSLQRARIDTAALATLRDRGIVPDVYVYARCNDGADLRGRMFAPFDGVPEDPATGSANCALAALLTHVDPDCQSGRRWTIAQGVEIGRPSTLYARTARDGTHGGVTTWIGGDCVAVSEGRLRTA